MTVPLRRPTHPLATVGIILSCAGFAIPVISGLVGALLGALALRAITTEPGRWDGAGRARAALVVGLLSGAVPLAVVLLLNRDDWGVLPILALLAYAGTVCAIAVGARRGAAAPSGGAVARGAALGAGGVSLAAVVLIGLVLAVIFLFQSMITGIAGAIGDAACNGK